MPFSFPPAVHNYINIVKTGSIPGYGEVRVCRDQTLLIKHIEKCFDTEEIYIDVELLNNCLGLQKYFPFELFEWEQFIFALHKCTFKVSDGRPRWPDLFLLGGRGLGKDGYISFDSFASISPYYKIKNYDIDICANNEDQATRPVKDVLEVLTNPEQTKKLKKHFYWNKEEVIGLKNNSVLKGRTNNAKGKDGLRSGQVTFNEVHQYESFDNINVFTTGLGKKQHPRRLYATTNGDVRGGPLDELLERSERILEGKEPDNGLLPFICRLDDKEEVHDEKNHAKSNPSLPYRPDLAEEIRKEYLEWKSAPDTLTAFMTKRMNIPQANKELAVADYANIQLTRNVLPDLSGCSCIAGIDYTKVSDMLSINLHFREGEQRFDINKAWLCSQSCDIGRIKAPWKEWGTTQWLDIVDDVEMSPEIVGEYLCSMGNKYNIVGLALDNYRLSVLSRALKEYGWDASDKEQVKLVRPSDIMQTIPIIDSCFNNNLFTWGDNPVLRWAANNTKKVRSGKMAGTDTGNYYYAKIEGRSRKTDPFMSLVASMVIENKLEEAGSNELLPVILF